jgi:hypothetical protein
MANLIDTGLGAHGHRRRAKKRKKSHLGAASRTSRTSRSVCVRVGRKRRVYCGSLIAGGKTAHRRRSRR